MTNKLHGNDEWMQLARAKAALPPGYEVVKVGEVPSWMSKVYLYGEDADLGTVPYYDDLSTDFSECGLLYRLNDQPIWPSEQNAAEIEDQRPMEPRGGVPPSNADSA